MLESLELSHEQRKRLGNAVSKTRSRRSQSQPKSHRSLESEDQLEVVGEQKEERDMASECSAFEKTASRDLHVAAGLEENKDGFNENQS